MSAPHPPPSLVELECQCRATLARMRSLEREHEETRPEFDALSQEQAELAKEYDSLWVKRIATYRGQQAHVKH